MIPESKYLLDNIHIYKEERKMLDRKYERQMEGKEKRRFEMEKLKKMTWKEKIEYLWMYYKIWLVVLALVIAAICTGVQMYHGITEEVLLNVTIVDGGNVDRTGLEKDVKELLGAKKKNQSVKINSNISSSKEDYNSRIALTTLIGAESVDVLICPKEIYEEYQGMDGLVNLEEMMPEQAAEGTVEGEAAIFQDNAYLDENIGVSYEPVYACVLQNGHNKENAVEFLKMLTEKQ